MKYSSRYDKYVFWPNFVALDIEWKPNYDGWNDGLTDHTNPV